MNEKFNENAKVEKYTNMLGIAVRLIVIYPLSVFVFVYLKTNICIIRLRRMLLLCIPTSILATLQESEERVENPEIQNENNQHQIKLKTTVDLLFQMFAFCSKKNPKCKMTTQKRHQKNFDYTTIVDRLRTMTCSKKSHPTGVVNRFTGSKRSH